MSYQLALEAAGARVLAFEQFGSYQGDWWARVRVGRRIGWIGGSFGSCSGCDAFEAEFGYANDACRDKHYSHAPECEGCIAAKAVYQKRLSDFGATYIESMMSKIDAIKKASENLRWDGDAQNMVDWIKAQK
jgi:hypothetical protein